MTINQWANGSTIVNSSTNPGEDFYPVINSRRVTRSTYLPYKAGSEEWRKAANGMLASHARTNFEMGRR